MLGNVRIHSRIGDLATSGSRLTHAFWTSRGAARSFEKSSMLGEPGELKAAARALLC